MIRATRRGRRLRRGMGLVELLVALSIAATLLTATAYALDASLTAYKINQQQAVLLQRTRLAMNRILTTTRRAKLHAPDTAALVADFAAGKTVTGSAMRMFNADGVEIIFRYDAPTQCVNMITSGTTNTLIEGVTAFEVILEPMRSAASVRTGGGWDLLKRASILMTAKGTQSTTVVGEGQGQMTMSASVMPRRNAW